MEQTEKEPFTLSIRKSDREFYRRLREEPGPLYGRETKELFLLSMAIGFMKKSRAELKGEKESYVRVEYLRRDDRTTRAIIDAVAVSESGTLDVLRDTRKVFEIAEEYAAGGIRILHHWVCGGDPGTWLKKLETDLLHIDEKAVEGIRAENQQN